MEYRHEARPPVEIPLDVLDQYARDRANAARRASYARHPERVMRQRITSAANLLFRLNLIGSDQHAAILAHVKGGGLNG